MAHLVPSLFSRRRQAGSEEEFRLSVLSVVVAMDVPVLESSPLHVGDWLISNSESCLDIVDANLQ